MSSHAVVERVGYTTQWGTGVFIGAEEEHLVVEFDIVGRVAIRRETWEKRSQSGSVVSSILQALQVAKECAKGLSRGNPEISL